MIDFFVSFRLLIGSPWGGDLALGPLSTVYGTQGSIGTSFCSLEWRSITWQILSGWCLEETQPPTAQSVLRQVTARKKLVKGRGKGADNISMSDLKLQPSWFKIAPEKWQLKFVVGSDQISVRIKSSLALFWADWSKLCSWVEWCILVVEMDWTQTAKCIFASDLFKFVASIINVAKMT